MPPLATISQNPTPDGPFDYAFKGAMGCAALALGARGFSNYMGWAETELLRGLCTAPIGRVLGYAAIGGAVLGAAYGVYRLIGAPTAERFDGVNRAFGR
jgi:hypothetical protein